MNPPLQMDGVLPPDLQGTLVRVGPGGEAAGALHAIELRDGQAVSYATGPVGSRRQRVLACRVAPGAGRDGPAAAVLPGSSRPEEFDGGLSEPIASHVHRDSVTGGPRLVPASSRAPRSSSPVLRIGEWDAAGALLRAQHVALERATWQHDIGLTARHVVFMESPTEYAADLAGDGDGSGAVAVPFRWTPGAEGWIGVAGRTGTMEPTCGGSARTLAWSPTWWGRTTKRAERAGPEAGTGGGDGTGGVIVMHVVRYPVPESGQPFDRASSVVGPAGIGASLIGGGLGVLERWRIEGTTCEQVQVDDRMVEYVQADPLCEGARFRHGYGVEVAPAAAGSDEGGDVDHLGLLKIDVARDEVRSWRPGAHRVASEPLFVRAVDGTNDNEGWLLTVVHDATRTASDIYVLDASSFGRRGPQAVIHLPASLPFRSHGTWVGADRYRR